MKLGPANLGLPNFGAIVRATAIAAFVTGWPLAAQETTENDLEQDLGDNLGQETPPEADHEPEEEPSSFIIDLILPARSGPPDEICERQADVARVSGEIIVCRNLDAASDGYWNAAEFERDFARRTQGAHTPNVDGSGLILPSEGSIFMVTVTAKLGEPSESPLIIDIEALPEPPAQPQSGTDADPAAQRANP